MCFTCQTTTTDKQLIDNHGIFTNNIMMTLGARWQVTSCYWFGIIDKRYWLTKIIWTLWHIWGYSLLIWFHSKGAWEDYIESMNKPVEKNKVIKVVKGGKGKRDEDYSFYFFILWYQHTYTLDSMNCWLNSFCFLLLIDRWST